MRQQGKTIPKCALEKAGAQIVNEYKISGGVESHEEIRNENQGSLQSGVKKMTSQVATAVNTVEVEPVQKRDLSDTISLKGTVSALYG